MSTQVYSNFEQRTLYRSSENIDNQPLIDNVIIPMSIGAQHVGPFPAFENANYSYDPLLKILVFHTEGVYNIGLTTAWSLTAADGRLEHYMTLNAGELPKYGLTAIGGVIGPINVGPALSSNVTIKIKVGDIMFFWCSGNNSGVQTLIGTTGVLRTEYFVTKIS